MKSTKDIRDFLIEQMVACAEGELEIAKAKALGNLAQQIYNTVNLELKVASAKAKYGKEEVSIEPVKFDE